MEYILKESLNGCKLKGGSINRKNNNISTEENIYTSKVTLELNYTLMLGLIKI